MDRITVDTPLRSIFSLPEFAAMQGQWIASATDWFAGGKDDLSLRELNTQQPTWSAGDMLFGVKRLREIALRGEDYVFSLSPASPAKLIALPADHPTADAVCLLLAGGGYGAVFTLGEALPVAARLNELGVNCYCLNYSTATAKSMVHGLMPKPLEDVAAAVRWIRERHPGTPYLMGGFSAGGNLCALWGTEHLGARHYSLQQPKAMLLDYPLCSVKNIPKGPMHDMMMQGLFGTGYNQANAELYDVPSHVDADYPPTWLIRAADDTTIPSKDPVALEEALTRAGVAHDFRCVPTGGHGFGLGSGTAAAGWVAQALHWAAEIKK